MSQHEASPVIQHNVIPTTLMTAPPITDRSQPNDGGRGEKLYKFTRTKENKYALLQAVRQHDAHRAPHGKKDESFTKGKDTVIANFPVSLWQRVKNPTLKIFRDKLMAMLAGRKAIQIKMRMHMASSK